MIFPIGDENIKGGAKPYISYSLIALNIIIFIFMLSLGEGLNDFYRNFAMTPIEIMKGNQWSTVFTNMFLHGGIVHVLGNMLFLWIFADNIEAVMGHTAFLLFYIAGGIVASMIYVFFNQTSTLPSLGASGAMSAIMGAYLVFFPKSTIKTILLFVFIKIPAIVFMIIWFIYQVFNSIVSINSDPLEGGTAWMAHIGGFLFGLLIALILQQSGIVKPENFRNIKT